MRTGTATRPRSWTSAARRTRDHARRRSRRHRRAAAVRQLGHPGRVADQVRRGEVGEVAHRRERSVDRLALQGQPRAAARRRASRPTPSPSASSARISGGRVGEQRRRSPGRRRHRPARGSRRPRARRRPACAGRRRRGPRGRSARGSGISSPAGPAGLALAVPALGDVTRTGPARTAGSPSRSVSICATSQKAAMWLLEDRWPPCGSRARAAGPAPSGGLPGSASARRIPAVISRARPEPDRADVRASARRRRRTSRRRPRRRRCSRRRTAGRRSTSATPSPGRRPAARPSRIATSVLCRPCSSGTPIPRSVASDSAAITSAARTRSPPCDATAARRSIALLGSFESTTRISARWRRPRRGRPRSRSPGRRLGSASAAPPPVGPAGWPRTGVVGRRC